MYIYIYIYIHTQELARRAGADPELGATLVAMAEMCNEGVDEACGALFKGLTFFLPREVRLSLPLHSTPLRWVLV